MPTSNLTWQQPPWDACRATTPTRARPTSIAAWLISIIGSYIKAEDAFAFVSKQLPLPEVVNNQGVAASRRGLDATSFFQQAVAADANDPDYQFNLAIALSRKKDVTRSAAGHRSKRSSSAPRTAKLRPSRPRFAPGRSTQLPRRQQSRQRSVRSRPRRRITLPLERIKRTFNEASFRQAAFDMEQMEEAHLATLPPQKQAAALDRGGNAVFQPGAHTGGRA